MLKNSIQKTWDDKTAHTQEEVKSVGDLIKVCFEEIKQQNSDLVSTALNQNNFNGYLSFFYSQRTFDVSGFIEQLVTKYQHSPLPTVCKAKHSAAGSSP